MILLFSGLCNRPAVRSLDRRTPLLCVRSIAARRSAAAAPQHGTQQQMRAVPRRQRVRAAKHRLVQLCLSGGNGVLDAVSGGTRRCRVEYITLLI